MMANKIEMNLKQKAELTKAIAYGLAKNPEFIKTVVQYNGASQIGYKIAEHTKEAVENIVR